MPFFCFFRRLSRRTVQTAKSSPYMMQFSVQKIAEIMVQKLLKISSLQKQDFYTHIWAYFGAKRRQFSAVSFVT